MHEIFRPNVETFFKNALSFLLLLKVVPGDCHDFFSFTLDLLYLVPLNVSLSPPTLKPVLKTFYVGPNSDFT